MYFSYFPFLGHFHHVKLTGAASTVRLFVFTSIWVKYSSFGSTSSTQRRCLSRQMRQLLRTATLPTSINNIPAYYNSRAVLASKKRTLSRPRAAAAAAVSAVVWLMDGCFRQTVVASATVSGGTQRASSNEQTSRQIRDEQQLCKTTSYNA